jgi:uncharacterized protein (DUF2147 family)
LILLSRSVELLKHFSIPALLILSLAAAQAQNDSILGNWRSPSGSIIQIYRCGANVCLKLIVIRKDAPSRVDGKNPNAALRTRPLCGLQVGSNFHLTNPGHAEGGQLYDPQSGKTYSGSMTRDGNQLKLRGYIGISLFGRTETWTRAPEDIPACHP